MIPSVKKSRSWGLGPQVSVFARAFLVLLFWIPSWQASAHESRPAYLELQEDTPTEYSVVWRRPAKQAAVLKLEPHFPEDCQQISGSSQRAGGGFTVFAHLRCEQTLSGREVAIAGLGATPVDVVVLVRLRSGDEQSQILRGGSDRFIVAQAPTRLGVLASYVGLGFEHILEGIDHLMFVLGLVLVLGAGRSLLWAITSFTVAHSVTLALSSLELVEVPQAPVEAVITLSIVFLASEIIGQVRGETSWTRMRPWSVTFAVGLLHGLGFAGALREVGLPTSQLPLALFAFNLGVELGQLAFVVAVLAFGWVLVKITKEKTERWGARMQLGLAYVLGTVAAYWVFERIANFF